MHLRVIPFVVLQANARQDKMGRNVVATMKFPAADNVILFALHEPILLVSIVRTVRFKVVCNKQLRVPSPLVATGCRIRNAQLSAEQSVRV